MLARGAGPLLAGFHVAARRGAAVAHQQQQQPERSASTSSQRSAAAEPSAAANGDAGIGRFLVSQSADGAAAAAAPSAGGGGSHAAGDGSSSSDDGSEISRAQADAMYEQLSAESAALPLADQPTALRATLRPYQRQALHWMLAREAEGDARAELHPSWRQYALPDGRSFYLQVTTGVARLRRPVGEEAARGGILADEMGLGKTVQLIALVLADIEAERNRHRAAAAARGRRRRGGGDSG